MKNKLKRFVASLSDAEIREQLADIFEWAKVYKELLESEQRDRLRSPAVSVSHYNNSSLSSFEDEDYTEDEGYIEDEYIQDDVAEITVDFHIAQSVQQKVSQMSVEETEMNLTKLRNVSEANLSADELALLHYEIDTCELHLFELTGKVDDESTCPSCGSVLEDGAKFCGKCGYRL